MKISTNLIKIHFKRLRKDDRGQALVLVAGALAILLGFGALTTDLGYMFVQRRNSQNIADAAALAGTWAIQNGEVAVDKIVDDYAIEHGFSAGDIESEVIDGKYVKAVVEKQHKLFLARILDIDSANVGATAMATRSSIWSSGFRDLLPVGLTRYEDYFYEEIKVIGKNGKEETELQLDSDLKAYLELKYPSQNVEMLLKTNLSVYKLALEYFISNEPSKIFGLVLGDSKYGSFGFIDLDGNKGGGASTTADWIDNGYNDILNILISENGNMTTLDSNLANYIKTRGSEAYIVAILPKPIDEKPNNWKAMDDEYLIIHVKDLKLIGSGGSAKLTGVLEEVFYPGNILLPGETNTANLPQSWIVK